VAPSVCVICFLLRQRLLARLLPLRFELAGHRGQGVGEARLALLFAGGPFALPGGLRGALVGEQAALRSAKVSARALFASGRAPA
jgi:hypothetical protein